MKAGKGKPRKYRGVEPTGLAKIRYDSGVTLKDMARKLGFDSAVIRRLEHGGIIPKNHPRLPRIAAAYGVSLEDLAPYLADKEMPAGVVQRLSHAKKPVRAQKPGTALVRVESNGAMRGPYNKLKKLPKDARQVVRGLIEVVNLNALKGNRFIELRAVPAGPLGAFLTDYLQMKGITGNMILTPDFVDHFDH